MKFDYFVGIDVSKKTLDASVYVGKDFLFHKQIINEKVSIIEFLKLLKKQRVDVSKTLFCAQNTGVYNSFLCSVMCEKQLFLWVENPLKIKRSQGLTRGKNDKIDSQRISIYAYKNQEEAKAWSNPRKILEKIKSLKVVRKNLLDAMNKIKRSIGEVKFMSKDEIKLLKNSCLKSIQALQKDIRNVEKQILELIRSDESLNNQYKLATSVDGVGMQVAVEVIVSTNEFKNFETAKQFACYSGVVPFEFSSGTSVRGRTRVSKMANVNMKTVLHMAALSTVSMQGELREYFIRKVSEGKNKMSVINAIRNKLILRIFACIKKNKIYEKNYNYKFA